MSEDRSFYVYEHWRPDKDVCFYVGKGRGDRARIMWGRNLHHSRIVDKLRKLSLSVEVRMYAESLSEKEALDLEIERIAFYGRCNLANLTDGGEGVGGMRHTPESKARISAAGKGKKRSESTRRKLSESAKASRQNQTYRETIRMQVTERWRDPEFKARVRQALVEAAARRPQNRIPHSDETKRKIAEAHKILWDIRGRKPKPARSERARKETARRSREEVLTYLSELGHRNKDVFMRYSHLGPQSVARVVVCESDGRVFDSASAAARHYGVCKSAVIEICLGKRNRKTVGGRVFSYEDSA